jgi:hypothetical protein
VGAGFFNLVGMGILPLQFKKGDDRKTLAIDGSETFDLLGQNTPIEPGQDIALRINRADGGSREPGAGSRELGAGSWELVVTCRINIGGNINSFKFLKTPAFNSYLRLNLFSTFYLL